MQLAKQAYERQFDQACRSTAENIMSNGMPNNY